MSRKVSEILVHLDWGEKHGRVRYKYAEAIDSPFLIGKASKMFFPAERLEEAEEIRSSLFNEKGFCNIAADVPKNGVYLLYLRPRHRLAKLMVNPESVIVDLLCNESESLCYSFFNPSNREAILVTGQIVEDIEGVYRKISSYPDDLSWRQYFVRRAMVRYEMPELSSPETAVAEIMNARQLAEYLGFEEKTIRNWTSEGTVPYRKVGGSPRYLKSEIDETLKAGTLGGRLSSNTKTKRKARKS
jgi:predicted DNA-binding transcriptional regulator AlpA